LANLLTRPTEANLAGAITPARRRAPRIALAGVSGYAGGELARLLLHHPALAGTTPTFFGRTEEEETASSILLEDLHAQLSSRAPSHAVHPFSWSRIADAGAEVLFLATPHEQSREWAPQALVNGIKVIDLSGAWRLHDAHNRQIYRLKDADPDLAATFQAEAVYGCPELHRDAIRGARLIANPGCRSFSRWRRCCARGWLIWITGSCATRRAA
jgi:N-acetyl-gamma-glutamyl-phosphate reductase